MFRMKFIMSRLCFYISNSTITHKSEFRTARTDRLALQLKSDNFIDNQHRWSHFKGLIFRSAVLLLKQHQATHSKIHLHILLFSRLRCHLQNTVFLRIYILIAQRNNLKLKKNNGSQKYSEAWSSHFSQMKFFASSYFLG